MLKLREELEKLTIPILKVNDDPDIITTVASLFKEWLRDLTDGIIPTTQFDRFKKATSINETLDILNKMPKLNFECLNYIMRYLDKVSKYSLFNKMVTSNIAIVFGPTLFRTQPSSNIADTILSSELLTDWFDNFELLFPSVTKNNTTLNPDELSYIENHNPNLSEISEPTHKSETTAKIDLTEKYPNRASVVDSSSDSEYKNKM